MGEPVDPLHIPILEGCPGCLRFLTWLERQAELPRNPRVYARYLFEHPGGHTGPIARELGLQKLQG